MGTEISLADISFWQDSNATPLGVDFNVMKTKSPAVIIRLGQGGWIDEDFHTNWENAKLAEMDRACYWFYDSRYKPSRQVELMQGALANDAGEGVIWLDIESDGHNSTYHGWEKWATCLQLMMDTFPDKQIGIYTAPSYWVENTIQVGIPQASLEWFAQFPLWIANYEVEQPAIPAPWHRYHIWQWGTPAVGEEWGVESDDIDMNVMDSDDYPFCFGDEVEVPEPPVELNLHESPFPYYHELNTYRLLDKVVCFRTPNGEELDKFSLSYLPEETVFAGEIPLYRSHLKENGLYNWVLNYKTVEEKERINSEWAFVPIQNVKNANGIEKLLHTYWTDGRNWDVSGCYIRWSDLENMNVPVILHGKVISYDGVNVRLGVGTQYPKIGALWRGSEFDIESLYVVSDDEVWVKPKDLWVAAKHNGYKIVEITGEIEEPSPIEIYEFKVPDTGTYLKVGNDFNSQFWKYEPRSSDVNLAFRKDPPSNPLPDTGKGKQDKMNSMSEAWQWFWHDLCRYFAPDMSEEDFFNAWVSITADTRALTDNRAAENGYMNYPYYDKKPYSVTRGDMEIKELTFGGNILKQIEDLGTDVRVEAFDPSKSPPTIEEALKMPHLIQWATQSTCYRLSNGSWDGIKNSKPFPQLRDKDGNKIGVPYPLMGDGGSIVFRKTQPPTGRKCLTLYPINNGVTYSPYIKR